MRREIFKYLRPYRVPFSIALLQVFLISAFEILKPWPMKIVIDHVLTGKSVSWALVSSFSHDSILLLSCVGLVLIYLFLGGMTIVNNYTTIRIGQRMVNDFRSDLYSHLQRLFLAFHSRRQVGDLLYRITADTFSIQALTMNGVFPIVTATALLWMMFFVMIRLDWQLTILALSICRALILTIFLMSRKIVVAATYYRERESEVYSVVQRDMSASVDAETEAAIMNGLDQLMVGRTTFIIAHRLSTVRAADKILVLRAGEVVEQGSFHDLVQAGGFFASLYRTQFGLAE